MNDKFPILPIEPILWLIASGIFIIISCFFLIKYFKSDREAKFILGVGMFALFFTIARTIETIRRYFGIGNYYDILEYNFGIRDLNLALRLIYYLISYIGIAVFYYVFEKNIIKKG